MIQSHNTRFVTSTHLRCKWLLGVFILFASTPVFSQSLGDIARQELERKQGQPSRTTHVYDNDDLARPQILLPEDQERVHASKKMATPPAGEAVREADGSDQKLNVLLSGADAQKYHAPKTDANQPKPRSLQPTLDAPSFGYPTPTRTPMHRAISSVPPDVARTGLDRLGRLEHIDKAIPRVEIAGNQKVAQNRGVRVQPGDTLWGLASRYLGQGKDWLVLVGRNPQVTDPQRLRVGTWVHLPDERPDPKPPERVEVKPGDSLWKLAQVRFGDGHAWKCVAQANPQLDNAHLIFPGQVLVLPDSCTTTSLAKVRSPQVSSALPSSATTELTR